MIVQGARRTAGPCPPQNMNIPSPNSVVSRFFIPFASNSAQMLQNLEVYGQRSVRTSAPHSERGVTVMRLPCAHFPKYHEFRVLNVMRACFARLCEGGKVSESKAICDQSEHVRADPQKVGLVRYFGTKEETGEKVIFKLIKSSYSKVSVYCSLLYSSRASTEKLFYKIKLFCLNHIACCSITMRKCMMISKPVQISFSAIQHMLSTDT